MKKDVGYGFSDDVNKEWIKTYTLTEEQLCKLIEDKVKKALYQQEANRKLYYLLSK